MSAVRTSLRHDWRREEVLELFALPFTELLYRAATVHRERFDPAQVQVSTLLSVKTGGCPEDCSYCPQAARYHTGVDATKLMSTEAVLEKAKQAKAAGRLLSELMLEACAGAERPHALLPIPLHRARLRQRGYDQALELARPIARVLGSPLRPDLLRRARNTAPQSRQLHASERHRNLRGAFTATAAAMPAHVALVDDVMTTGATLRAAAEALRQAGVERIDAWVCAHVP